MGVRMQIRREGSKWRTSIYVYDNHLEPALKFISTPTPFMSVAQST